MSSNGTCPTPVAGSVGQSTILYLLSSPPSRIAVLCVSALCFLFVMALTWLIIVRHVKAGFQERMVTVFIPNVRKLIITQVLWVQVTAFFAFCSLLFPAVQVVFNFMVNAYQALALYWFTHLISAFVGGREGSLRASKENGKTKLYAVMPFGCCFAPCHKPMYLSARRLVWARFGIIQACGIQPINAFIALFLRLEGLYVSGSLDPSNGFLYLLVISLLSTMTAMYFVFVIQRGLGTALQPSKPRLKFLLVKILIPLFALQQLVINYTYLEVHEGPTDPIFPVAAAPALYHQFITLLETVPLAILAYFSSSSSNNNNNFHSAYPVHGEADYHVHMKTAECQTDFSDLESGPGHQIEDDSHHRHDHHEKKKKRRSKSPKDISEDANGKE